jgi:hypothetical protein
MPAQEERRGEPGEPAADNEYRRGLCAGDELCWGSVLIVHETSRARGATSNVTALGRKRATPAKLLLTR